MPVRTKNIAIIHLLPSLVSIRKLATRGPAIPTADTIQYVLYVAFREVSACRKSILWGHSRASGILL